MILSTFLAVRESEGAFCWRLIAFSRMAGATIGAELFLAVVPLAVEATSAIVVAPAAAASLAQDAVVDFAILISSRSLKVQISELIFEQRMLINVGWENPHYSRIKN
jgi:hypothetical protein